MLLAIIKTKTNKEKIILSSIVLIALAGFLLPAVIINIDLAGISQSISLLNIISFFNKSGTQSGKLGMFQSGAENGGGILAGAGVKLMIFAGFYLLTVILLIITLICVLAGKSRRPGIITAGLSLILHICTGWSVVNLKDAIYGAVEKNYGFIASFINIYDKININFGVGYWITGTAIISTVLTAIVLYGIKTKNNRMTS